MIKISKLPLVTFLLGALIGSVAVYKLRKPEVKVVTNTEVKTEVRTIERVIKNKDGTQTVEIIKENKTDSSVINTIPPKTLPKYKIGLSTNYDFHKREQFYGLLVTKPISEKFEVGVQADQRGTAGAFFTIGF